MLNFTRPYRIFLLVSFLMATVKLQRRFLLRDEQNGSPSIGDLHHGERVKSLNKCDTSSTLRCFLLRRVPLRFRVAYLRPYFALPRKITNYVSGIANSMIVRVDHSDRFILWLFSFLCFPKIQCCRKNRENCKNRWKKNFAILFVDGRLLSHDRIWMWKISR